jgi:hypothetical protein
MQPRRPCPWRSYNEERWKYVVFAVAVCRCRDGAIVVHPRSLWSCRRELYCIDATCLAERRVAIYNAKWQEVDAHAEQEVVRGKGIQKLAKAMPSASVGTDAFVRPAGRSPRSTAAPKPTACETMEERRFSTALGAPTGVLAPARENGNQSRDHFWWITFPI